MVSEGGNLVASWLCGLAPGILWGCSQAFSPGSGLWRPDWSRMMCSRMAHSHGCSEHQEAPVLAGCRKDMLGSSPRGPLHALPDYLPNMAANFPQSNWSRGKRRGISCAFYDLQVILHHVHSILLVKRKWLNIAHTQEEGLGFASWREADQHICGCVFKSTTLLNSQVYYCHLILRLHTSISSLT